MEGNGDFLILANWITINITSATIKRPNRIFIASNDVKEDITRIFGSFISEPKLFYQSCYSEGVTSDLSVQNSELRVPPRARIRSGLVLITVRPVIRAR